MPASREGRQPRRPRRAGASRGVPQAALWGLGRSIALDHPASWGGLVDLDPDDPRGGVRSLAEELLTAEGDDHVALRSSGRYVARLVRSHVSAGNRPGVPV